MYIVTFLHIIVNIITLLYFVVGRTALGLFCFSLIWIYPITGRVECTPYMVILIVRTSTCLTVSFSYLMYSLITFNLYHIFITYLCTNNFILIYRCVKTGFVSVSGIILTGQRYVSILLTVFSLV